MSAKTTNHVLSQADIEELDCRNIRDLENEIVPQGLYFRSIRREPAESDGTTIKSTRVIYEANAFHCKVCGKAYSWREVTLAWFGWVCASCLTEILTSEKITTSEDHKQY